MHLLVTLDTNFHPIFTGSGFFAFSFFCLARCWFTVRILRNLTAEKDIGGSGGVNLGSPPFATGTHHPPPSKHLSPFSQSVNCHECMLYFYLHCLPTVCFPLNSYRNWCIRCELARLQKLSGTTSSCSQECAKVQLFSCLMCIRNELREQKQCMQCLISTIDIVDYCWKNEVQ